MPGFSESQLQEVLRNGFVCRQFGVLRRGAVGEKRPGRPGCLMINLASSLSEVAAANLASNQAVLDTYIDSKLRIFKQKIGLLVCSKIIATGVNPHAAGKPRVNDIKRHVMLNKHSPGAVSGIITASRTDTTLTLLRTPEEKKLRIIERQLPMLPENISTEQLAVLGISVARLNCDRQSSLAVPGSPGQIAYAELAQLYPASPTLEP